jgi:hypothetical protein
MAASVAARAAKNEPESHAPPSARPHGLQLDFPNRDLPFQFAIPTFKPPRRLARNKQGTSGDQREKRTIPDIEPIKPE